MSKKKDKRISKALYVLAIISFIITFVEGCYYYMGEECSNIGFRIMMILQNSVKAFGFNTAIDMDDVLNKLNAESSQLEIFVSYAYGVATFTAPYCTIAVVYRMVSRLLRLKGKQGKKKKKQHILVFGYNEETQALLMNQTKEEKKRKIHLVTTAIAEEDELELLRLGITVHKLDCLTLSGQKLESFWEKIQLPYTDTIILFEESSARNFSLYYMFHTKQENAAVPLRSDVKFFCRCEEDGISQMLENYYDGQVAGYSDLELISVPQLRVRKMLQEHPLHSYYLKTREKDPNNWNLHLLVIGFGKLGQEVLKQTMNQGVTGSRNSILIDVVDCNMEEKQRIFANHFSDEYVEMDQNEYAIPSDRADGQFRIRFHKMDIRYKEFAKVLREYGDPQKDGIFTYIAICVEDMNISLRCLSEIERYFRRYPQTRAEQYACIGLRMEKDKQLLHYFNTDKETYQNVFAIEDSGDIISLDILLRDELDADAKEYNRIYSTISIQSSAEPIQDSGTVLEKEDTRYWKSLKLFRRDSSRALAQHADVKEEIYDRIQQVNLEELFGTNGSILKHVGNTWVYEDSEEAFVQKQSDRINYPLISEISRMEHRRWCYFMASCGWKRTTDPWGDKDDRQKSNPCMCTWDELVKYQRHTCCYDLMPLLLKYKKELHKES